MEPNQQQLEARIAELEKYVADRKRQQIQFPLDIQSQQILGLYFMHITGIVHTIGGAGGNEFTTYVGFQDAFNFEVAANTFIPYSVTVATDIITVQKIAFQNDMQVYVSTSGTPPSPLDTTTNYFVVNAAASGLTFQLSLTQGGAAINITDSGDGSQYIYFF